MDFGKSIELSKDRGVELLTIVFLSVLGIETAREKERCSFSKSLSMLFYKFAE